MSTLKVNAIQNTSGVEQFLAKAWVNFNGTGTVAIRASGNVSSITDNGVGDYTVNFTAALADANYAVVVTTKTTNSGLVAGGNCFGNIYPNSGSLATGSVRVCNYQGNTTSLYDAEAVCTSVFR